MSSEMQKLQQDLLESVRQMKRGEAVRVTKVRLPAAAEARAQVGLSQLDFASLLGVSAHTLHAQVLPAYDALKAEQSRGLSVDQIHTRLGLDIE